MNYELRLFIIGHSENSQRAIQTVRTLCEQSPSEHQFKLEIIDTIDNPSLTHDQNILATPTLVRLSPLPQRRIIGDLSDCDQLLDLLTRSEPLPGV